MIMQIPIDEIIRLLGATDPDKILGIWYQWRGEGKGWARPP